MRVTDKPHLGPPQHGLLGHVLVHSMDYAWFKLKPWMIVQLYILFIFIFFIIMSIQISLH